MLLFAGGGKGETEEKKAERETRGKGSERQRRRQANASIVSLSHLLLLPPLAHSNHYCHAPLQTQAPPPSSRASCPGASAARRTRARRQHRRPRHRDCRCCVRIGRSFDRLAGWREQPRAFSLHLRALSRPLCLNSRRETESLEREQFFPSLSRGEKVEHSFVEKKRSTIDRERSNSSVLFHNFSHSPKRSAAQLLVRRPRKGSTGHGRAREGEGERDAFPLPPPSSRRGTRKKKRGEKCEDGEDRFETSFSDEDKKIQNRRVGKPAPVLLQLGLFTHTRRNETVF